MTGGGMLRRSSAGGLLAWALGLVAWWLVAVGCDRPDDRPAATGDTPAAVSPAEDFAPVETPAEAAAGVEPEPAPVAMSGSSTGLRFVFLNLENWLTMDRYQDGRLLPGRPKPDEDKAATVEIIASGSPAVLGVCEIGTREDLDDLRGRLAAAGVDLPHAHHSGGVDSVRRLALLSRFPIVATAEPEVTEYRLDGRVFRIQRGILDATVEADGRRYRFLGVHFKSKREVPEGDQELMRRNEAELLRRHVDAVLAAEPQGRLVVFGDLNDTTRTRAVRAVQGAFNSPGFLTALRLADSRGHVWTYQWNYQDIYSRFDYVMVNAVLLPEVDKRASRLLEPPGLNRGSDHRALLAVFR